MNDGSGNSQGPLTCTPDRGALLDDFVEREGAEIVRDGKYLPDEIVTMVLQAECYVRGTRYFIDLFKPEGTVSLEQRVKSVFTGAVAFGRAELATEAYGLL